MSLVYAAWQRAFGGGGLRASVVDLSPRVLEPPLDLRPEPVRRQTPGSNDPPAGRDPSAPDERRRLPPVVGSQLAKLAQLLHSHPARPRTIAFIASARGEGTTTCVANMAAYLARQQSTVLMVDANLPCPALHEIAGASSAPGLVDVMAGHMDVATAIQATAVRNLFVLTSGEREPGRTNRLVLPSVLRERLFIPTADYDFVLVDCPALGAYEDAAATAATCDAALLVVEGGRTLREQAQASKTLLERADCSVLGVVMNKRKFYVPKFLYDRL